MTDLIPKHGGYRKLKSFQIAQIVYDITVRFCERYIERFSEQGTRWFRLPEAVCKTLPKAPRLVLLPKTGTQIDTGCPCQPGRAELDYEDFLRQRKLFCGKEKTPETGTYKCSLQNCRRSCKLDIKYKKTL